MDMSLLIKIVVVLTAASVGIGSVFIGKYIGQQDNPTEEIAEEVIKKEIGIDIDLTPQSQEQKEITNAKYKWNK